MALSADDYLAQLQAFLPTGAAWPRDADAALTQVLAALAAEFSRVDARAEQLVDEADPRTTTELFVDWERVAGLPDACAEAFGGTQTSTQRRSALIARLVTLGGQSAGYYVALAAALGYAITITEFHEINVEDDVEYPVYGAPWSFAFQVNAALNTIYHIAVEDDVEQPIAVWGNALLECMINRYKPAHTVALFSYE